jgi:hypothetical protein
MGIADFLLLNTRTRAKLGTVIESSPFFSTTTELESLRAMNSSYCPWAVEINDLFDKGYDMINKDFVNTKALMEAPPKGNSSNS